MCCVCGRGERKPRVGIEKSQGRRRGKMNGGENILFWKYNGLMMGGHGGELVGEGSIVHLGFAEVFVGTEGDEILHCRKFWKGRKLRREEGMDR